MRFIPSTKALVAVITALVAISSSSLVSSFSMDDEGYFPGGADLDPLVPQHLKITNLLRTLDLSKPLVREITSAALQNVAEQNVTDYYFPVDQVYTFNLAHISAENRKTKESLKVIKDTEFYDSEYQYYQIKLVEPLAPGEKIQITVKAVYTGMTRPFPTHARQDEKQQFVYFGNPFALTAYPTTKQKTTVITPNSVLEVFEHPPESTPEIKNNQVILGPYHDVKPLEHGIFEIQYQLSGPIYHVRHLLRDIEVSQWGDNLAVEEHYNLVNKGALLKGQFSRVDYQKNPAGIRDGNGILGLQTRLPKQAAEIYYRDEIGNISTSALVHQPKEVLLNLKPRFPIFGGWNTTFYIGYNVPLKNYLRQVANANNKYVLKVPFVVPMMETTYEDVLVRVVLPEGSK
ncbi:proteasome regulatory particle base subunit [Lunasporangiospora selenospora]|uniref:Dolichyl-diphosphooligosaccharide--protein glycosyltransferase subunit 1 n=1 Tax=Lunasporangiospora selenospora TaxID=979761 RepID=A0A9P6FT73_9FUNG|nr:proteasome regulatory particle base subunit [Lunasporangiospora selenospora]